MSKQTDAIRRAAAMDYLGINKTDFLKLVREGRLRMIRDGRDTLVLWNDVVALKNAMDERLQAAQRKREVDAAKPKPTPLTQEQWIERKAQEEFQREQQRDKERTEQREFERRVRERIEELKKEPK